MIKAVIFDLWETLGTKNIGISKAFFEHFAIPESFRVMADYEAAVQLKKWPSENDMAAALLTSFSVPITPENISWTVDLFQKGIDNATLYPGVQELLLSIKQAGYRLGLISNTTVFEAVILDRLQIRGLFDVISFSWELELKKPASQIFLITLERLSVLPGEAIFIDDGQKNIEAAILLGIQGIRFEQVEKLRSDLNQAGLILPNLESHNG